jgi:peptidoglycan hydrolase-like protein with peptidoglycan-binding domain
VRRAPLAALAAVVIVAAGAGVWQSGVLGAAAGSASPSASPATAAKTAKVSKRTLQVSEDVGGTLGYAGQQVVQGGLAGTLTWLPALGATIDRGGRLYEVNGREHPILMIGTRPAWRQLASGVPNGADVAQLEQNLKALGFAGRHMKIDTHWDAKTTAAVKRWQKAAHLPVDGTVDLGEVVFLPSAIRITDEPMGLGSQVGPGAQVETGTQTTRVVTVALETTYAPLVKVGTPVTITLPDGSTTAGHVTSIGRVASSSDSSVPGGGGTPTVDMTVGLDDPKAGADLDKAPVTVHIVSVQHANVLAVPVSALVALLEGGYAVEILAADGTHSYVRVTLGIFQGGWVEVSGTGVAEGATVVVTGS